MSYFKKYRRKQIAELREVTKEDIENFRNEYAIIVSWNKDNPLVVSISDVDKKNGFTKIGDMIARNPKNHFDQWLVAESYFNDNFESIR